MNNVVLVHGGFVDGSGWEGVYKTLTRNGYSVTVVQILRCRWKTTWRTPSELWQQRTALRFSLATPTVER